MIGKQKVAVLVSLFLVMVFVVGTVLFLYHKKQAEALKVSDRSEQENQTQSSESAQNPEFKNSSKIPLPSDLPSGIGASTIGPVGGKQGKATVIAISNEGTFSLVMEAKLADPSNNQFYEAWLGKSSNDTNLLKLGKLTKNGDLYSITFNQDGDFSAYKIAVVTLEANDDNKPETKILEGSM